MCPPVIIALMVVSALAAQQQQKATNKAAAQSFQNITAQRDLQGRRIQQGAANDIFARSVQQLRDAGSIRVAAGEAGVTGNSVAAILGESVFNRSFDVARTTQNARNAQLAAGLNAQSAINQVPTTSNIELAGSLAGIALSGAGRRPSQGTKPTALQLSGPN